MRFNILVISALLALTTEVSAEKLSQHTAARDFNGADEDEIMDKVFSKYSQEGTDHNGVKNGVKILMKSTAPKAAGVILEATHKLKGAQVPGYMKANFEKAWDKFDINQDGFIKAEETHTFMRSLMGKLNKFALAPGSLSDIGTQADIVEKKEPVKKAAPVVPKKAAPAPKPKAIEADAEDQAQQADDEEAVATAVENMAADEQSKMDDSTMVDLD